MPVPSSDVMAPLLVMPPAVASSRQSDESPEIFHRDCWHLKTPCSTQIQRVFFVFAFFVVGCSISLLIVDLFHFFWFFKNLISHSVLTTFKNAMNSRKVTPRPTITMSVFPVVGDCCSTRARAMIFSSVCFVSSQRSHVRLRTRW